MSLIIELLFWEWVQSTPPPKLNNYEYYNFEISTILIGSKNIKIYLIIFNYILFIFAKTAAKNMKQFTRVL